MQFKTGRPYFTALHYFLFTTRASSFLVGARGGGGGFAGCKPTSKVFPLLGLNLLGKEHALLQCIGVKQLH